MPTSMPVACEVYYKLRTEKIQESRLGDTLSGEDTNALLEGKQNIGKFPVEFDPANELYDLFYKPLNENGQGPEVEFNRTIIRARLDAPLNSLATLFNVTIDNPEDASLISVESPIQIGNEILVVSSVTSAGSSITLEVETRGDHGTEKEDHATGDTVILLRYSVPHNTIRLDGFLDSGLPLRVIRFLLANTVGPLGAGIEIEAQLPNSQIKTLRSIQIQLSTILWPEDLSNVTGLSGIRAQGIDGEVTQGGTSLTTQTSLAGFAGKSLYTHEGIDLVTGEISFGRCVTIDNVVDNGNGSWTANVTGDWVFKTRFGEVGVSRTINWIVADGWLVPGHPPTWVADHVTKIKDSTGSPGDPLVVNTHRATIITGASVYARGRLVNWLGVGPWTYWDGVTGSANRADAVLFLPGADTTVPFMVTVVVRSIGLNVFLNMAPLAGIEGYKFFRFYRVRIYLDAARTEELLNITTPEHTQRGGDPAVAINFQVPAAGEYWYEVIPVNSLGDGAPTLGSFIVSGLSPTLADGVPGAPSIEFKELLQEGLGASYTLRRPATGHAQIGLYTAVARDNDDFDFVYNDTSFVASLDPNRDEVVSTTDVFSASSVGKLIELTGIDTGGISGQRHLFIVTEYVNERLVKTHRTWRGSSQVGLVARIGDPWWNDSHRLWHQNFFVVGPTAVASPLEENFDFAVPIQGETLYVSAFAISIFGESTWASSPSGVATSTFEDLVQQYESPPTPVGDVPRHALAWTTDIRVRPVDNDTIRWDAGSVEFSDGVSQSVSTSGSPRTLSPSLNSGVWFIYKLFSSSTLQFTQNFSTAIGDDRIQLGIIVVSADTNNMSTVLIKGDSGGPHISAQSIAVNVLSALTANLGDITAGTITGLLIQTRSMGSRIQIRPQGLQAIDAAGITRIEIPTSGELIDFRGYGQIEGQFRIDIGSGSPIGILWIVPVLDGSSELEIGTLIRRWRHIDLRSTGGIALTGDVQINGDLDMGGNRIRNAVLDTVEFADPTATLSASSTSVSSGSSVTLFWSSTNGITASINQGVGAVTPIAGGSVEVTPTSTTTYEITITGIQGTTPVTASIEITVTVNPPTIDSFNAPASVDLGDAVPLSWETTDATSVDIRVTRAGVTLATLSNLALDGSTTYTPGVTGNISFQLRATNTEGTATDVEIVVVSDAAPTPPTINSFNASPSSITLGDSVSLSWGTSGSTSRQIQIYRNNVIIGILNLALSNGLMTYTPTATGFYRFVLEATNSEGSVSRFDTVTVNAL